MFSDRFWPEQIRSTCGCVVDALRHSVTFDQVQIDPPIPMVQTIVDLTLPVCVERNNNVPRKIPFWGVDYSLTSPAITKVVGDTWHSYAMGKEESNDHVTISKYPEFFSQTYRRRRLPTGPWV